jgi:hypothetical protein
MSIDETIKIILLILSGIISTLIPCVVAIVKSIKSYKEAKTRGEREKATNDMLEALNKLVFEAENTYKDVNALLKQQGKSAGAVKKDVVMTKLQAFALENNYLFDAEYWSAKIDEIIELTRKVNAKQ